MFRKCSGKCALSVLFLVVNMFYSQRWFRSHVRTDTSPSLLVSFYVCYHVGSYLVFVSDISDDVLGPVDIFYATVLYFMLICVTRFFLCCSFIWVFVLFRIPCCSLFHVVLCFMLSCFPCCSLLFDFFPVASCRPFFVLFFAFPYSVVPCYFIFAPFFVLFHVVHVFPCFMMFCVIHLPCCSDSPIPPCCSMLSVLYCSMFFLVVSFLLVPSWCSMRCVLCCSFLSMLCVVSCCSLFYVLSCSFPCPSLFNLSPFLPVRLWCFMFFCAIHALS